MSPRNFGDLTVLDTLNLTIEKGEIVSLLGPSGCGKTTLLRIDRRPHRAGAGSIRLAGRGHHPRCRRIAATSAWCSRTTRCSPPDRRREYRVRPQGARRATRRDHRTVLARRSRMVRLTELRRPLDHGALGRPAAARRGRPRAGGGARAAVARRAVQRARPQAARDHADRTASPCCRENGMTADFRHPRPGGSARDVGPHRGDEQGQDRAVRRSRHTLRAAGDQLRARVRRPVDPDRRPRHGRIRRTGGHRNGVRHRPRQGQVRTRLKRDRGRPARAASRRRATPRPVSANRITVPLHGSDVPRAPRPTFTVPREKAISSSPSSPAPRRCHSSSPAIRRPSAWPTDSTLVFPAEHK